MRENQGLYRQQFEHDNCGIGAVVNSKGVKSHQTVENALKIVENLEHRAGKDAEGKTGDFCRFPTNSLKRNVINWELPSAERENTVLHSCSSLRMS